MIRFQVIAPTSPARMTFERDRAPGLTIPFAIVAATSIETNAPTKLRIAAISDRGARRQRARRDARRDRVRGVVEAVREVEEERDDDDRDEREVLHGLA